MPKLKNNQLIHFTLTNNPGKEYDAQIYSLCSSFAGDSKAVSVHAKVQGDKIGLIDGMNITAVISLEKACFFNADRIDCDNAGARLYFYPIAKKGRVRSCSCG